MSFKSSQGVAIAFRRLMIGTYILVSIAICLVVAENRLTAQEDSSPSKQMDTPPVVVAPDGDLTTKLRFEALARLENSKASFIVASQHACLLFFDERKFSEAWRALSMSDSRIKNFSLDAQVAHERLKILLLYEAEKPELLHARVERLLEIAASFKLPTATMHETGSFLSAMLALDDARGEQHQITTQVRQEIDNFLRSANDIDSSERFELVAFDTKTRVESLIQKFNEWQSLGLGDVRAEIAKLEDESTKIVAQHMELQKELKRQTEKQDNLFAEKTRLESRLGLTSALSKERRKADEIIAQREGRGIIPRNPGLEEDLQINQKKLDETLQQKRVISLQLKQLETNRDRLLMSYRLLKSVELMLASPEKKPQSWIRPWSIPILNLEYELGRLRKMLQ